SVEIKTKNIVKLDNGDYPVIHPLENKIIYIKSNQIWVTSLDDPKNRRQLFDAKGANRTPSWSPDGKKLAFVSRRNTHSFIGIYEEGKNHIEWIAPSLHIDNTPSWSPDGSSIAFIRRNATGGALDSLTAKKTVVWNIMKYDFEKDSVSSLYTSPNTPRGSLPSIAGSTNLNWPLQDYIVFISYKDGWPHLYKLNIHTREVIQETKGDFEISQLSYNKLGNKVLFSANTGKEEEDRDRKHLGMVDLEKNKFEMITEGDCIEVSPLFLDNNNIVYLKGGVRDPFLPEIKNLQTGKVTRLATKLVDSNLYKDFVVPKQVTFTSPDGVVINGQLFNVDDGRKNKPALLYIHGGPRRQMYLGWHNIDYYNYDYITNQYLANQGFVVLSVNYRRGTGYGFDFQNPSNAGPLGSKEYIDILTAGKWLQKCDYVDSQNIGIFGGSYGGTLTAMGLGKNSDLFKFGVDVHGRHSREKRSNLAFYPPDYELASKIAWDSSPAKYVDSWTSPVLLIHGDDDQNVPFDQSIDIYNRLIERGVEVEVLVIPDETHHWMLQRNLEKIKSAQVEFLIRKAKSSLFPIVDEMQSAMVGISIYDEESREYIVQNNADIHFTPASNTKILTAYAALKHFGDSLPGWKYFEGKDSLYISPMGDPTFLHPSFESQLFFNYLKSSSKPIVLLLEEGIPVSRFATAWSWNTWLNTYSPERSEMPIYGNMVRVVRKNGEGIIIPSYFCFINETDKEQKISLRRDEFSNNFYAQSSNIDRLERPFYTQENDSLLFKLLRDTLHKAGFNQSVALSHNNPNLPFKTFYTEQKDSVVAVMIKKSDNFIAEQLLLMVSKKILGEFNEIEVKKSLIDNDFKNAIKTGRWVDGSGLSKFNLFTPNEFVALLIAMQNEFGRKRLSEIFPHGGEGTLSGLYKNYEQNIFAKTGTLGGGTLSLSGYLTTKKGKKLIFSVIINNHRGDLNKFRKSIESRLIDIIESY
ncbi:MAG: prolyl oligopeptidase family serine peptidase, partial [Bacteroidales bacterium]